MTFHWKMVPLEYTKGVVIEFHILEPITGIVPRCPDRLSGKRLLQVARGMYAGPELAFDKHLIPDIVLKTLEISHE